MCKRAISILLICILLFSMTTPIYAETAASMTSSMISFYKDSRQTLDVTNISGNELAVYGVFISNFMIPGSTRSEDLVGDEFCKSVAIRFFGSESQTETVKKLNAVLFNVIKESKSSGVLYLNEADEAMNGTQLFEAFKIAFGGTDSNMLMTGTKGSRKPVFPIENKAVQAVFKTLFAINPEFYFDAANANQGTRGQHDGRGIGTLAKFFIDAMGNIWGSYLADGEVGQYVLIMPACINPYLFKDGNNYKYPVTNAFVMGALADIADNAFDPEIILNGESSSLKNGTKGYPFLAASALDNFTTSRVSGNMLKIIGITTPGQYHWAMAELNEQVDLLKEGKVEGIKDSTSAIKNFLRTGLEAVPSDSQYGIILHTDVSKFAASEVKRSWSAGKNLADFLGHWGEGSTEAVAYLVTDLFLTESEFSADFSWFNFNSETLRDALSKRDFNAIELDDFTVTENLFYRRASDMSLSLDSSYVSPLLYALTKGISDGTSKSEAGAKFRETAYKGSEWRDVSLWTDDLVDLLRTGTALTNVNSLSNTLIQKMVEGFNLSSEKLTTDTIFFGLIEASKISKLPYLPRGTEAAILRTGLAQKLDTTATKLSDAQYSSVLRELIASMSIYKLFSANGAVVRGLTGTSVGDVVTYKPATINSGFATDKDRDYKIYTSIANETNVWANIYWAYTLKLLDVKSINSVGGFSFTALPKVVEFSKNVTNSFGNTLQATNFQPELTNDDKQKELLNTVMELLSPNFSSKRNDIISGIVNGFLIGTHRAVTGSGRTSNKVIGVSVDKTSSYSSVVGYISTPGLRDLPFTSWVLKNYTYIYIFLLLLVFMTLIMMVICNIRTVKQGFIIFIVMVFALVAPQSLLNNSIVLSNKFADMMFSDRFMYWAIAEHALSLNKDTLASAKSDVNAIIQSNVDQAVTAYSHEGSGVKVKWMAPKKNSVFEALFNDVLSNTALGQNLTLFKWLFSSFFTGDEYVSDDPFSTYVYRSYTELAKDAKRYYEEVRSLPIIVQDVRKGIISRAGTSPYAISENLKFIGADYYTDNTGIARTNNSKVDIYGNTDFSSSSPFNVKTGFVHPQAHLIYGVKAHSFNDYENESLKTGLSGFNTVTNGGSFNHRYWHLLSDDVLDAIFKDGTVEDDAGLYNSETAEMNVFLSYTESPFYYFYNVMANKLTEGGDSFKSVLMNDSTYIYHKDGMRSNKYLRDFLDLEGLFTHVVPVLYQGNLYVRNYTDTFGKEIETYNFTGYADEMLKNLKKSDGNDEITAENGADVIQDILKGNLSDADKIGITESFTNGVMKKERLKQVWNMYTPWVDYMYELPVANKKGKLGGKYLTIGDTLNPGSYDEVGRPMIYSPADMMAKHYNYTDLTDVERRIQKVLEDTYRDMLYLLNYYDFDDEALLTASAMLVTFNFNKEFSGSALLGNNAVIYPQSYELKNFNYDAFLRLTLMNATGIPFSNQDVDIYEVILEKTSWFTGLLIVFVDLMAVYAIPACKTIILLMLLFLGLIFCMTCVVARPDSILKSLGKSILFPTALFMGCNMAFALMISLFMGEGLTAYVGSKTANISLQDPTVTVILLILISGIYMWMLFKLIMLLFKTFRNYGASTLFGMAALATTVGGILASRAGNLAGDLAEGTGKVVWWGTGGALWRKYKRNQNIKDMRDAFSGGNDYRYGRASSHNHGGDRSLRMSYGTGKAPQQRPTNTQTQQVADNVNKKTSGMGGTISQTRGSGSKRVSSRLEREKRIKKADIKSAARVRELTVRKSCKYRKKESGQA